MRRRVLAICDSPWVLYCAGSIAVIVLGMLLVAPPDDAASLVSVPVGGITVAPDNSIASLVPKINLPAGPPVTAANPPSLQLPAAPPVTATNPPPLELPSSPPVTAATIPPLELPAAPPVAEVDPPPGASASPFTERPSTQEQPRVEMTNDSDDIVCMRLWGQTDRFVQISPGQTVTVELEVGNYGFAIWGSHTPRRDGYAQFRRFRYYDVTWVIVSHPRYELLPPILIGDYD